MADLVATRWPCGCEKSVHENWPCPKLSDAENAAMRTRAGLYRQVYTLSPALEGLLGGAVELKPVPSLSDVGLHVPANWREAVNAIPALNIGVDPARGADEAAVVVGRVGPDGRLMIEDITPRPFVASDADVDILAVALLASERDFIFGHAEAVFGAMMPAEKDRFRRLARCAFEHPGYLPSVVSARRDAARCGGVTLEAERRRANELDRRCGELATNVGQLLSDHESAMHREQVLKAEVQHLHDELARRPKPAEVVALETRDAALVRVTRR